MRTFACFLLSVILLIDSSSSRAENVKIAVSLKAAPEMNSSVQSERNGIELALEHFKKNHPGGVAFELVQIPYRSGHESVSEAGRKIVFQKLNYVIGGEMSDEAIALAEEFEGKPVLMITPTASVPTLTAGRPLVFRACASDEEVADQLAKYVGGLRDVKSIGVLQNTANAYTDYITNTFMNEYQDRYWKKDKVSITEFRYATETPNFESAAAQFKKNNVDLVIAFTLQESLRSFFQSASKIGFFPLYLGSDGWTSSEPMLNTFGKESAQHFKAIRFDYWNDTVASQAVKEFKSDYEKRFKSAPDSSAAVSYDAAMVLFDAISRSKDKLKVEDVAETMRTASFSHTVTAPALRFGRGNSPKKPLYLYQIQSNSVKFMKAIQ